MVSLVTPLTMSTRTATTTTTTSETRDALVFSHPYGFPTSSFDVFSRAGSIRVVNLGSRLGSVRRGKLRVFGQLQR